MTALNLLKLKIVVVWMACVALLFGLVQFAWAAQFVPIPGLDDGTNANGASRVSRNGKVVVGWSDSGNGERAYRWTAADGVQSLGVGFMPGSTERVSQATAISADGEVIVGWTHYFDAISSSARQIAFTWTSDSGFDTVSTSNGNSYIPNAIVSNGIDPDGIQKAWMILLDIYGDSNNDGDVDGQDLFNYTAAGDFVEISKFFQNMAGRLDLSGSSLCFQSAQLFCNQNIYRSINGLSS